VHWRGEGSGVSPVSVAKSLSVCISVVMMILAVVAHDTWGMVEAIYMLLLGVYWQGEDKR